MNTPLSTEVEQLLASKPRVCEAYCVYDLLLTVIARMDLLELHDLVIEVLKQKNVEEPTQHHLRIFIEKMKELRE